MQNSGKIKVADLNSLLTCVLCNGYYIDATTIIECLHSFCRTCIVQYLQTNKYCPICDVQIHKTRPLLNIRSDQTLQDIVYKLVPGLYKNEMKRRRDFYSQNDTSVQGAIPLSSEKRGDVTGCDRLIFTADDIISVSLEYYPQYLTFPIRMQPNINPEQSLASDDSSPNQTHRRYLRCPGAITVHHLKRLLNAKYELNRNQKVDIMYMHDYLHDEYTLTDLAYIYSWRRNGPLRLFYKIQELPTKRLKRTITEVTNSQPVETELPTSTSQSLSTCTHVSVVSPAPSMAAAPSSRHPSPPPSPQMAEEPSYVKMSKPNSAAMLNEHNVDRLTTKREPATDGKTFGLALEKAEEVPNFNSPKLRTNDGDGFVSMNDQHLKKDTVNGIKTVKKSVTFSEDLVQTFYPNSRYRRKTSKITGEQNHVFRNSTLKSSLSKSLSSIRNPILSMRKSS